MWVFGNISGGCSECCCHLSVAHAATDPKTRGIFLQHRLEKRFDKLWREVGREGHEEGQELKILAKRRNSDVGSSLRASNRSCEQITHCLHNCWRGQLGCGQGS